MNETRPFLIYGANGYTGQLIAELAQSRGHRPVLAGRSEEKLAPLGKKLGLEVRAFPLEARAAAAGLKDIAAVLHCAGPFSATSAPMVEACLAAGAHYLDVTGEHKVIAAVLARDAEAKARSISLLPAVGFDVVPSDCLALALKEALPTATWLELAFASNGRSSPGTMKTAVEGLPEGGLVRRDGKLQRVPAAHEIRNFVFEENQSRTCMSIPWGDLVSAFASTKIPNITVYMSAPPGVIRAAKLSRYLAPILKLGAVQRFAKRRIEKTVQGPNSEEREKLSCEFFGRVRDDSGRSAEARLTIPGGYTLTAEAALESTLRAVRGEVPAGALTPAQAFGSVFITELPGTKLSPVQLHPAALKDSK